MPPGKAQKAGDEVLGDAVGIAPGRAAPRDTRGLQVRDVHVIRADRSRADEANPAALQQALIHSRRGADRQNLRLLHIRC